MPKRMEEKREALRFLEGLHEFLDLNLPHFKTIADTIEQIEKNNEKKYHPEDMFLYEFAIPLIHKYILEQMEMDEKKAKESILSELYRKLPNITSGSPTRRIYHPFNKRLHPFQREINPLEVINQWKGLSQTGHPFYRNCPDLAIRNPFPHKIVFEGKYFSTGNASKEFVMGIYEAFLYRGLPYVPAVKNRAAWDYDFACLLAFDASPTRELITVWDSFNNKQRKTFWDGANIYVMIMRGSPRCNV
jgi:hypothetical protein